MDVFVNLQNNNVLIKDFSNIVDFHSVEEKFSRLSWKKNMFNSVSEDYNFFDEEIFSNTKRKIEQECCSFLRNAHGFEKFEKLIMTNSWGNITRENEIHHLHHHPFSVVSGVIYLDDNPENLNFFFETNNGNIPYFLTVNRTRINIKDFVEKGNNLKHHAILFLSNINHGVDVVKNNSMPRRSISFNTFWKGMTGESNNILGRYIF